MALGHAKKDNLSLKVIHTEDALRAGVQAILEDRTGRGLNEDSWCNLFHGSTIRTEEAASLRVR